MVLLFHLLLMTSYPSCKSHSAAVVPSHVDGHFQRRMVCFDFSTLDYLETAYLFQGPHAHLINIAGAIGLRVNPTARKRATGDFAESVTLHLAVKDL